jgi:hypothetical protein
VFTTTIAGIQNPESSSDCVSCKTKNLEMAKITKEQVLFLLEQNIPLNKVYDASGISSARYKREMKELGKEVAIGVTPCQKLGHTMRTRYGHCAQCNTHAFAYMRRYSETAYVYIAKSEHKKLLKIGVTNDIYRRESSLNSLGYGGTNDWRMRYETFCEKAGRVEKNTHEILFILGYQTHATYIREGRAVCCEELFRCTLKQAVKALEKSLQIIV